MELIKLVFINVDATPRRTEITCNAEAVPAIREWYMAFHHGDDVTIIQTQKEDGYPPSPSSVTNV